MFPPLSYTSQGTAAALYRVKVVPLADKHGQYDSGDALSQTFRCNYPAPAFSEKGNTFSKDTQPQRVTGNGRTQPSKHVSRVQ